MLIKLTVLLLLLVNFSIYADVFKWVDKDGITHYSNVLKKNSRNISTRIKFVQYKKVKQVAPQVSTPEPSNNYTVVSDSEADRPHVESVEYPHLEPSRTIHLRKKSRNYYQKLNMNEYRGHSIETLNQRCEDTREELLAPLRDEAIEDCMYRRRSSSRNTRENCERINKRFGYGGLNYRGFYIKRLFHDIPDCQESYEAWNKRRRKMRGYSE